MKTINSNRVLIVLCSALLLPFALVTTAKEKDGGDEPAIPSVDGLTFQRETTCRGGVRKIYKNASTDYQQTIDACIDAFKSAGFTGMESNKGGGYGSYGGREAWGYHGDFYVKINAQVQEGLGSVVYICIWPKKPHDDDCGEHCDE